MDVPCYGRVHHSLLYPLRFYLVRFGPKTRVLPKWEDPLFVYIYTIVYWEINKESDNLLPSWGHHLPFGTVSN